MKWLKNFSLSMVLIFMFVSTVLADNNLYEAGVVFYRQGKYDQALKYLSDAIKKNPENAKAIYYFANSLVKTYNIGYAEKYYQKVIDLDPNSDVALYAMEALNDLNRYKNEIKFPHDSLVLKDKQLYSSATSYIQQVIDYGTIIHWRKDTMPRNVYIAPSRYKEYEKFVWDAFKDWESSSAGLVSFEKVDKEEDSHIVVNWDKKYIDEIDYDLSGYVFPKYDGKELSQYYIHLVEHDQEGNVLLPKDLMAYALHLIGHSLGINAHSKNKKDAMFESGNDGKLTRRDVSTLHVLYELEPDISNFSDIVEIPQKDEESE